MACNNYTIRIVEGNAFTLVLPLKKRTYVANVPLDEDIDIMALVGYKVTIGGVEFACTLDPSGVQIPVAADALARGTYDVIVTAEYRGAEIRAAYFEALQIVKYNKEADAQQFIAGSPIVAEAAYVIGGPLTDAELEALKAEWREKIAETEQARLAYEAAKEAYDRKAEALDDVAQQSTLTQGISDIRGDISHIDIDTTTLAKEVQVKDGNDTAISVGKEVRSELGTGSDTAAETGTLFAVVKWVKDKVKNIFNYIGTPAQGQPSTLFEAIAAGGSGGGGGSIPQVSVPDTGIATSQALDPNTLYIFPNRTSDLTLTLGTALQDEVSEYHFIVEVGSTLPTITLPSGLTWRANEGVSFDVNGTYEVSILEEYAIFVKW